MQNPSNICPQCQSPIPADAPGGLCPACVLLGVAGRTNPSQAAAAAAPTMEEVAAAFPDLEVLEILGQGGMGMVFKARQLRLDRLVALKVLPPALAAQAGFAERFTREARVLARLAHPNIVAIHDFGESAGFFYLIMEFVNGVNLRAAMRAGVTPEQALLLVPRICEALQFAHDHGVLHRDIKPENILLDTAGTPKLADFGIAKLAGDESGRTSLTATGHALGTAAYMAPEQVEKPATVDHRADIYSLGVVLYEMLTGELPLGRFSAPSEKSTVNRGVDEVVMRALEKQRERRQQSATEMKTQVEGAAHGASHIGARPIVATLHVRQQDALVTRILLALCALSGVGIPLTAMLDWQTPDSRYMVALTILFGTLAGLSKLFVAPMMAPAPAYPTRPKEKNLGVAYLLWFILGPSGLHKFYLGEIGWGFLYLFTGGLFFIGWIIDLFTLPEQVRRYNEKARLAQPTTDRPTPFPSVDPWPKRIFLLALAVIAVPTALVGLALVVPMLAFRPTGDSVRPAALKSQRTLPPATVVTAERSPFMGELPQGSIELVSVSPHPANDERGWRMDGSPALEGPFVNRESTSTPQHDERAYDIVFRSHDLPAEASSPTWHLSGTVGWDGGGKPFLAAQSSAQAQTSRPETPVPGYHVITALFPQDLRKTDIRMGVATGTWKTLWENRPTGAATDLFSHKGEDWVVTQGSAVETKEGETVVTYTYSVHEHWQTRVVALDAGGKEIPSIRSSIFSGRSEWRFEHLSVESIRQFRFQVRPYDWVEFQGVALAPSGKSGNSSRVTEHPAPSPAISPSTLDVHYLTVDPSAPGVYKLTLDFRTPFGWVADFSCRIRDEKGERELPAASYIVAQQQPSTASRGKQLQAEVSWEFDSRDRDEGSFQLNAKAKNENGGSAGSSSSSSAPYRWELQPGRNEATRYMNVDSPLQIPFLRGLPSGIGTPSTPGAEMFILVKLRPLKPAERAEGFLARHGQDRFEKLIPNSPATELQDLTIQRAAQRLDETRARIRAGMPGIVPVEAAELELAVAEARGDALKIATARLAYAEAHAAVMKARFEAGTATREEATKAGEEIKTARGQLENARNDAGLNPGTSATPEIARRYDENIRAARERWSLVNKQRKMGGYSVDELEAAERNLAVAEARGDDVKAAMSLLALAEAHYNQTRVQVEQHGAAPAEARDAEQKLNTARSRLEEARAKAAIAKDAAPLEKPGQP